MTDKLFDALETCLQALEQGEDVETALRRYPDLAKDLRPILEASLHARTLAATEVPAEAQRRGRARLLQRVAELREAQRAPRRSFLFTFRPLAVALMLVIFFLGGTGLVRASSGALPGDNLYPVKRGWEEFSLLFVADEVEREGLELEHENERFEEIRELLARGRTEKVSFSGYVVAVNGNQLNVGGLPVNTAGAALPDQPVMVGAAVMVTGVTQPDGTIQATQLTFLPPDVVLPTVEPEEFEQEDSEDSSEEAPHPESDDQSEPDSQSTPDAPESDDDDQRETDYVIGDIEMMQGALWLVNGRPVDVSTAEIIGIPAVGVTVRIEGYYTSDGRFVATRIEVVEDDSGSGGNDDQNNNDNENDNSNDDDSNSNDDDHNDNSNDNKNDNDNDDD